MEKVTEEIGNQNCWICNKELFRLDSVLCNNEVVLFLRHKRICSECVDIYKGIDLSSMIKNEILKRKNAADIACQACDTRECIHG